MEEVKVEIISKEDIRPSSPTPSHLRIFKHSSLDQIVPVPYVVITLFYTSHNPYEFQQKLELLKQSLSETLTQFYPLGGKIKDDISIDCNDEGANFVVAKVNCSLEKFLSKLDLNSLDKFIPIPFFHEASEGDHVTNIQLSVFDCGGIAIGFCISHRTIDGESLSTFVKVWTERTGRDRNSKPWTEPNFAARSLFPTRTLRFRDLSKEIWGSYFKEGKWATRRFLFTNSTIATLKARILEESSSDPSKNLCPTRVQIVSALLWKCFMAVTKAQFGAQKPSELNHFVNLRRKMEEPMSLNNSIGNFLWLTSAKHMAEHELDLAGLVTKLSNSIQEIDKDFVARLQSEEGSSIMEDSLEKIREAWLNKGEELEQYLFSSWCNFGHHDADDFGWGKPIWVSSVCITTSVHSNTVIFVDTRLKDGIEAWVTLDEKKMKYLESCTELLAYATVDPSPLAMEIHKIVDLVESGGTRSFFEQLGDLVLVDRWFRCGDPFDVVRSVFCTPRLDQLVMKSPRLDALSVVGDASGDSYEISHDFKRDWTEKEGRNIDLIFHEAEGKERKNIGFYVPRTLLTL
ncbi:hypothetical protein PIB30_009325 [Stylosanthes scabra]|uniref:Uncharacterized protein n=1 Tax=Stylosanthes scabra TaxID=79078 RepID=A0ABU6U3W1_9FABA|nr:hypothetical protein [Stylosanthes scabra]